MASDWYFRSGSRTVGPFAFHELVGIARQGRLSRDTEVRQGHRGDWVAAERVPGLMGGNPAGAPRSTPPPLPSAGGPPLDATDDSPLGLPQASVYPHQPGRGRRRRTRHPLAVLLNVVLAILVPGSAALAIVWFIASQQQQNSEPKGRGSAVAASRLPPIHDGSAARRSAGGPRAARIGPHSILPVAPALPVGPPAATRPETVVAQAPAELAAGADPAPAQAAPDQAVPPPTDARLPVPPDAAEKAAAKMIRDVYGSDYDKAKTPDARIALAKRLIADGIDTQDDAVGRYSMFRIARDIAADAGDIDTTFEAIAEAGKRYKVDSLQARVDFLLKIGKAMNAPSDQRDLIDRSIGLANEAIARDRYEIAKQCATFQVDAAGRANNPVLLKWAATRAKKIDDLEAAFGKVKGALATLEQRPVDADANLAAGKFYCFERGDWRRGLPMLARGSDSRLRAVAEQELANPIAGEERLKLADAWWDAAQTEAPSARLLQRSLLWSRIALPQLKGLDKARIEKRLRDEPASVGPDTDDLEVPPTTVDLAAIAAKGPFACRAAGVRTDLSEQFGGTKATERAVGAALYWLAKHQSPNGSWSLQKYREMCTDRNCTGVGRIDSLSAATALGLLPFLAAGQTQGKNGPFQRKVAAGVYWLLNHQKRDGDLSADAAAQMYSHALATIAVCEDYGITRDGSVGRAARNAINFIQAAQNTKTGGWRYHPGEEGDISVGGWQLMALKSAQMAGLSVNPATLAGYKKWLDSCSAGGKGGGSAGTAGRFSYQPDGGPTPTMSAVGILCNQYLHAGRADPIITGGVQFLMANQPEAANHNVYYWYYATQVMHNMADKDWDTWNRKMRKILVESQSREGCSSGSWDPEKPNRDAWGPHGGRLMMTSLSCLTLEIYYRYLPVYRSDAPVQGAADDRAEK